MKRIKYLPMCFLLVLNVISLQAGKLKRDYWINVSGSSVASLTSDIRFPNDPSGITFLDTFEAPSNWNDNYGQRLYGFIYPPVNGNYKFWISGDDNCELWLSTTESPNGKSLIAKVTGYTSSQEWEKYPEQKSISIYLEANKKYYIEALHKDGTMGDNLAVGWQLPDGTYERPIPGERLTTIDEGEDYTSWPYFGEIKFNTQASGANVIPSVYDFPVLIRLNEGNFDFSQASSTGDDLRFSKIDNTHLSYQIERWSPVSKLADIWVSMDTVFGNSNVQKIKMYWGKTGVSGMSNGANVFPKNKGFVGVWHLNELGNNNYKNFKDATGNGYNATGSAMTNASTVDGIIGKCQDFNGISQQLLVTGGTDFNFTSGGTISAWVYNRTDANKSAGILCRGINQGYQYRSFIYKSNNGFWQVQIGNQSKMPSAAEINTWQHLSVSIKKGGKFVVFVNGSPVDSGMASSGEPSDNTFDVLIGLGNNADFFNGKIDEPRWYNKECSYEWIKLNFENQKIDQKFITFENTSNQIKAPSEFNVTGTNTTVNFTWIDNSDNEDGFEIKYGTSLGSMNLLTRINQNTTSYQQNFGLCDLGYYFSIQAYKTGFYSQKVSSPDVVYTIPCTPINPQLSVISPSEIAVTWQGNASEYSLEYKEIDGLWNNAYIGSAKSFLVQGLLCNTLYVFRVKSQNLTGQSDWSNEVTGTTQYCQIQTPTGLIADNNVADQIILNWIDNADNEDGYKVFRKTENDADFSLVENGILIANSTSFSDNSIICNRKYQYYVSAFDNNAVSGNSNIVEINAPYCGMGRKTSDMITISGVISNNTIPENIITSAVVKLYRTSTINSSIYEEVFDSILVKNGYYTICLGLTKNLVPIITENSSIYYDIIMQGTSVIGTKLKPLTASPYIIKNQYCLNGIGSPVGIISAPVGASYVDTDNKELYIKFGENDSDWQKVGY